MSGKRSRRRLKQGQLRDQHVPRCRPTEDEVIEFDKPEE